MLASHSISVSVGPAGTCTRIDIMPDCGYVACKYDVYVDCKYCVYVACIYIVYICQSTHSKFWKSGGGRAGGGGMHAPAAAAAGDDVSRHPACHRRGDAGAS